MTPAAFVEADLLARNDIMSALFRCHAVPLAECCRRMADRFRRGGRLLAFGRGACATDAQHVEVEFVHPVIVGKRALPALDLSASAKHSLLTVLRPHDDIVMAFGPPAGDRDASSLLAAARAAGALTFALPGVGADFSLAPSDLDPFVHQELVEILYHTLWETVHVFLEHDEVGQDVGETAFLYPFLDGGSQPATGLIEEVATSIRAKAAEVERLRERVAHEQAQPIADAVSAIRERVERGGGLLLLGNGGSATDANDWAHDCVASPKGHVPVPAISLAGAPALLSALANDLGAEELFRRQVIAHGRAGDVVIALSTSGGSRNVMAALGEAQRRGMLTVALLGCGGGEAMRQRVAEHAIVVHCDHVPRIQEVHASVYHVMLDLLDALRRGATGERVSDAALADARAV